MGSSTNRNPIARVVRHLRKQVIPDKRQKSLADEYAAMTREEISYIMRDGHERRDQSPDGQVARENHNAARSATHD